MEKYGFNGKRCAHFDFGEALRKAASKETFFSLLSEQDLNVLSCVLKEGALLENETFYIAEHILFSFIDQKNFMQDDQLILNGLPRHVGQAKDLEQKVLVQKVVHLVCEPEVVFERIRQNTGGDRKGRIDDSLPEIKRKLTLFSNRTLPLIHFYQKKGVEIIPIEVKADSSAEMMGQEIRLSAQYQTIRSCSMVS